MAINLVFGQKEVQDNVIISSPDANVITLEFSNMDIVVDIEGQCEMDSLLSALLNTYGIYNADVEMIKEEIKKLAR